MRTRRAEEMQKSRQDTGSHDVTSRTTFSLPDLGGRRAEFVDFYRATYPVVAGELLAMTGSPYVAHVTAGVSYTRAWQAWPSLRTTEWPAMWVRADAFRRVGRPLPARGAPPIAPLQLEPEDQVLVNALQRLPAGQRRSVVLHYMARLPVDTIVEWFGGTVAQVDGDLDAGFAALVGVLDWSDDPMDETGDPIAGDAYDWTAEALEESAQRLQRCIPS